MLCHSRFKLTALKEREQRVQGVDAELAQAQQEADRLQEEKNQAEEPERSAKQAFDDQWTGLPGIHLCITA